MTRPTVELENLNSMTPKYHYEHLHKCCRFSVILLYLGQIFFTLILLRLFFCLLLLFQHSQKKSASTLSCYLQLCKFSSYPKHSTVLQNSTFSPTLLSIPIKVPVLDKGSTCKKTPLLLVSYCKPVPQFSVSEALLMPLST